MIANDQELKVPVYCTSFQLCRIQVTVVQWALRLMQ